MNNRHGRRNLRVAIAALSMFAAGLAAAVPLGADAAVVTTAASALDPAASVTATAVNFFPQGQVVDPLTCTGAGQSIAADPSFNRNDCGFVVFTVSGVAGAAGLGAELVSEGATSPFEKPAVVAGNGAGTYQVSLTPKNTWPAGPAHLYLLDKVSGLRIADLALRYNTLKATLSAPGATKTGAPFTVTGTVVEHDAAGADKADTAVPASFDLVTAAADGRTLDTQKVTALTNGTFTATVPGAATAGLVGATPAAMTADVSVTAANATYADSATGAWKAASAGSVGHPLTLVAAGLVLKNSFVSSVGWVKPAGVDPASGVYPSTVTLTNGTGAAVANATVTIPSPDGTTIRTATPVAGRGTAAITDGTVTWTVPSVPVGVSTLVVESRVKSLTADPRVVWKDLSSVATLTVSGATKGTSTSHGPKVIPPDDIYNTARYGDRPFPIVPVQYSDRTYQASHSGETLAEKINSPAVAGSTYNLYQEMSLGQLFPNGTVPSAGIASADFTYAPGFSLTKTVPGGTCTGTTTSDLPTAVAGPGSALYPTRITNGIYNLPGQTQYYGADANGSAVVGSAAGVAALQNIDAGCGPTGKLVADAAALADPDIDYSDYDTDKDGVVDFFMVVNAGCGGNGGSQLGAAACPYPSDTTPYDNIWPHSSSLEGAYSDPITGLPGLVTDDQLKDLEGHPLWFQSKAYDPTKVTTTDMGDALKEFVRVGPYNVNPETAIDKASVISHEYGHSLGLPDFYSTGSRETYGDWNLMATDKSHNMDAFSRQELGWVVPEVLKAGQSTSVTNWTDSKRDTGVINWQTQDGKPYTLKSSAAGGPNGIVHNSEMYVAKLPGRTLLDPKVFTPDTTTGNVGASASHLWWSGSGNDFGCSPTKGRNFDLAVPGLKDLPPNTPVKLSFKSNWDIEWDFDYAFVLTSPNGTDYTSHASDMGYTSSTTDPTAGDPNMNSCLETYDNGITGTSGSYQAGTEVVDRKAGNTPAPVFLNDSYDVSDLAGTTNPSIRFSYSTDGGLARPGWFIDDVKVVATINGVDKELYTTDFENGATNGGGPKDPVVYNGGCANDLTVSNGCTQGWKYLTAGVQSIQDHAYYLEMRDRSGFDFNGRNENDRDPIGWTPGLYLGYTDEAHGYGNVGTDDPPAQSPLDSSPEVGSDTPNLNDAAYTAATAKSVFSDTPVLNSDGVVMTAGHVDNYTDPTSGSGNWEFNYSCLGFKVDRMTGDDIGPDPGVAAGGSQTGNLTGDVTFTMGKGCGAFNYGYNDYVAPPVNKAPFAKATATPNPAMTGQVVTFTGLGSTDAETASGNLTYSWDFGDGGTSKDATGRDVSFTYPSAGTYQVRLTVDDGDGQTTTVTVPVTVTGASTTPTTPGSPSTPTTPPGTPTTPSPTTGPTPTSSGPLKTQTRIRLPKPVQVKGRKPVKLLFQVVGSRVSNGAAGKAVVRADGKKLRTYQAPVTTKRGKTVSGFALKVPSGLRSGKHRLQVRFTPSDPSAYLASTSRSITLTVVGVARVRARNAVDGV